MMDTLCCYQQLPLRKNWDKPSPKEVAESLKMAHNVNRQLVTTVNELYDERRKAKSEMDELRTDLKASRLKNTILTSIFSSAVTSAIIGIAIALVKMFHLS
jgi:hypothetical protein